MSKIMKYVLMVILISFTISCGKPRQEVKIERWGSLKSVVMMGEDQGRVSLSEIEGRPGVYGVGALENLAGEIIVLDGRIWHAQGASGGGIVTSDQIDAELEAALLIIAEVSDWNESTLPEPVAWSELEATIGRAVYSAGLNPGEPVPFLIEGHFENLEMHVLGGSCPYSQDEDSTPPFRLNLSECRATLCGFYFEGEPGILTHKGQFLHLHALTDDEGFMVGHVDAVSLGPDCKLKLP
jgi:acetolactate decarboxylase